MYANKKNTSACIKIKDGIARLLTTDIIIKIADENKYEKRRKKIF